MTMRVKGKKADVKPDFANIRAKLLVHGICDEQGTLLFTEAQVVALGKKIPLRSTGYSPRFASSVRSPRPTWRNWRETPRQPRPLPDRPVGDEAGLFARADRTIQSDELIENIEYWKLDPFGCEWRQPAKICATLVNVNRTDGGLPLDERHFIAGTPPKTMGRHRGTGRGAAAGADDPARRGRRPGGAGEAAEKIAMKDAQGALHPDRRAAGGDSTELAEVRRPRNPEGIAEPVSRWERSPNSSPSSAWTTAIS